MRRHGSVQILSFIPHDLFVALIELALPPISPMSGTSQQVNLELLYNHIIHIWQDLHFMQFLQRAHGQFIKHGIIQRAARYFLYIDSFFHPPFYSLGLHLDVMLF